jgi:transposase
MSKFTTKEWFIGIDISKNTIDVAILHGQSPEIFIEHQFSNNLKGFDLMLQWLSRQKVSLSECLFCMEHTGNYGLLLFFWLTQKEADFCVEPGLQIKRSLGMVRGKNDKIDARRIAGYANNQKSKLKPFVLPAKNLIQIKQLLTYREQLVKVSIGFKNSIKGHEQYEQISELIFVVDDIKQQLEQLSERITQVETQVTMIIDSDQDLKQNFKLATSVRGIGPIIASYMLVTTNNFKSFDNGRQYCCFAGTAPFEESSGLHRGGAHVSHLADKKLKTLLSNGANSACIYDPELKAYYQRKKQQGKIHKSIINAISCKLVNRVFAVIKRQTPYVVVYKNNFV